MKRFLNKFALLFRRNRFRRDLDEEMAFHRAQAEEELIAGGMSREAAHSAALRRFGNATCISEQSHDAIGFRWESVTQDVRFALRQLKRGPGFAMTAAAILALGMGVSVAIFAFVDVALLQPLPYAAPNRLMSVDESTALFPRSNISRDDYNDWKRMNRSFQTLDAYTGTGYLLRTASGAEPVPAARVSDGFFSTLGVKMMLGRGFLPGEDQPGKAKIVILTYGTWLKRFGGRRDVVGQPVTLSGESYMIVGVLPRAFEFAPRRDSEFWVPLLDRSGCEQRRSCHNLFGVGRLREGVTMESARTEMKAIAAQLERQYPGSNRGQSASVMPLAEIIVGPVRPVLLTLLAGAGLLLLIACVNVSSLLLVRSESRRREIAVRGALGATPARLTRQFITEGLLLAAAGCAGGLLTATWLISLLARLIPANMLVHLPFLGDAGINLHVLWFAAAIALLAAFLLAALPVVQLSFQDLRGGLTEGDRGAAGRLWHRLGANLVVTELAVAVVLLAGAGLLGRSFYRLLHVDDGFDTTHLATVRVMAPDSIYTKKQQKIALYGEIERRLGVLPGVESVGITNDLPVQCNCDTDWIRIPGKPYHGEHNEVNERDVNPAYFATLRARLLRGRALTGTDDANHPWVTVINQALAKKYFPGEDPIGKMIGDDGLTPNSMRQIVGVIANVREGAVDDAMWPSEYFSIYHETDSFFTIVVRTAQDEKAMLPSIVSTLHGIDPNVGVFDASTMTQQIESLETSLLHRFSMWLVGGFAAIALVLGVVGLYSVVAYSVSRRTREIGVRMALGAQRGTVYAMVMGQAWRLTVVGLGIGLAGSVCASLLMRRLLFGVHAWDVPTLIGIVLLLGSASMAASFLPARRAASVNPIEALRTE